MGKFSTIEWCDSTVNPTTGCDGCELWHVLNKGPCYAGNLHEARLARSLPNLYAPDFTEVRLAPGRMVKAAAWSDLTGVDRPDKPWLNGMPRIIFVGDMGDVMSRGIPPEYLKAELIDVATSPRGRRHIWMVLTKQGRQLAIFAEWLQNQGIAWPANVWAGVSVTSNKTVSRVKQLLKVPAAVRFVSYEPAWEYVDFSSYLNQGVHLIIVGGESDQGPHEAHSFHAAWARGAIMQCRIYGAKPFIKQLGAKPFDDGGYMKLRDSHGGDMAEWPEDLRVREFPAVATGAES